MDSESFETRLKELMPSEDVEVVIDQTLPQSVYKEINLSGDRSVVFKAKEGLATLQYRRERANAGFRFETDPIVGVSIPCDRLVYTPKALKLIQSLYLQIADRLK